MCPGFLQKSFLKVSIRHAQLEACEHEGRRIEGKRGEIIVLLIANLISNLALFIIHLSYFA